MILAFVAQIQMKMKAALLSLCYLIFSGAIAGKDTGKKDVQQKDLPLIACDVCERAIAEVYAQVEKARSLSNKNRIEEIEIENAIDAVCKPDDKKSEWIRRLDISEGQKENGKTHLVLTEPGGVSKCEQECATIAKSCEDLFQEEFDRDELSSLLWKNKHSLKDVKEKVCKKFTKRCTKKKALSYKRVDFPFNGMSEKDLQMEQLMAEMKSSGMGGMKMYNREDMDTMMNEEMMSEMYGDGYDEYMSGLGDLGQPGGYEDDANEDAGPPPKSNFEF